jgi:hypothetical protein
MEPVWLNSNTSSVDYNSRLVLRPESSVNGHGSVPKPPLSPFAKGGGRGFAALWDERRRVGNIIMISETGH